MNELILQTLSVSSGSIYKNWVRDEKYVSSPEPKAHRWAYRILVVRRPSSSLSSVRRKNFKHLLQNRLPYIFQVLYVLCFTRPRYQVSVYMTTGPLVRSLFPSFLSYSVHLLRRVRLGLTTIARISTFPTARRASSHRGYICTSCRCDDAGHLDYLMGIGRLKRVLWLTLNDILDKKLNGFCIVFHKHKSPVDFAFWFDALRPS